MRLERGFSVSGIGGEAPTADDAAALFGCDVELGKSGGLYWFWGKETRRLVKVQEFGAALRGTIAAPEADRLMGTAPALPRSAVAYVARLGKTQLASEPSLDSSDAALAELRARRDAEVIAVGLKPVALLEPLVGVPNAIGEVVANVSKLTGAAATAAATLTRPHWLLVVAVAGSLAAWALRRAYR